MTTHRLQDLMPAPFLAVMLALSTLFLGLGNLSQNLTSGGYQLFEPVVHGVADDNPLIALEDFDHFAKVAPECCNAPNRGFTKDTAFDTIDQFRSQKGGLDELGDSIPSKGDGQGTVAFVDVDGKPVFGVNSSTLVRDADKNLGRSWIDRLGLGRGEGQIVWHAEGHSLMRAYEKTGGNMPSYVNMFVDRVSCPNCRTHLPKLADEMGIDNLILNFKDGKIGRISNGIFEWVE